MVGRRKGFAPIAIGLALTLIHLVGITGMTNLSVNPAAALGRPYSLAAGRLPSYGCSGWL